MYYLLPDKKDIYPVAENLHENTYLAFENCDWNLADEDVDLVGNAYNKVFSQLDSLKNL